MFGIGKFVRKAPKRLAMATLRPWSVSDSHTIERLKRLDQLLNGARVAIVGNAQSIFHQGLGEEIDGHDAIVRMNHGVIRSPDHQGSRTEVLCVAAPMSRDYVLKEFGAPALIHTSAHRTKIRWSLLYGYPELYFAPRCFWEGLKRDLKAPPSTGLMAIEVVSTFFSPRDITLYGFDWMSTKSFYHDDVLIRWHDWDAEAKHVGQWLVESPESRRWRRAA